MTSRYTCYDVTLHFSERSEIGTCRTGFGVPNPPTCIYLGQASETSLTICWSPPNDNGGGEIVIFFTLLI